MERTVTIVVLVLGFFALSAWWLEDRFGAELAITVLLGVTHLLAFAGGAVLSFAITRGSLRSVNEYAKNDAVIDRYRQQTFKEQARGDSAWQRAAAKLLTTDVRNVDRIANQRANAVIRMDREARKPQDTWGWGDDNDDDGYMEGYE